MDFIHPEHPGRRVRLAYCQNLHAGEDLDQVRAGIEAITLPLQARLAPKAPFGVGMYLAAPVAAHLAGPQGQDDLASLGDFLASRGLVPFTFNAFPFGDFHRDGLKEGVYWPLWSQPERADYTRNVARVAARLVDAEAKGHLSISTHPGGYGDWTEGPATLRAYADGMAAVASELASIEAQGGPAIVLSLEAEPRASAGNSAELAEFLVMARLRLARHLAEQGHEDGEGLAARHLGTCLDTCHAAVEFESPAQAWRLAQLGGPCGKLQFSSALMLEQPASDRAAAERLLDLAEPRYLHQVNGRGPAGPMGAADLPEVAGDLDRWLACDEWRCHFHVPVDLASVGGLATTRGFAAATLRAALADPNAWASGELHVEIETYTWDILPAPARGPGELVDGLEREYRHVIQLLGSQGWRSA